MVISDKMYVMDFRKYSMAYHGKDIRNYSGNRQVVGIGKIMVSPIVLLKCCYQFGPMIPLAQQRSSEHFSVFFKVLILETGSSLTDLK